MQAGLSAEALSSAYVCSIAYVAADHHHLWQVLPLAFVAQSDGEKDVAALWRDVWEDATSGTPAALRLYISDIVPLITAGGKSAWPPALVVLQALPEVCFFACEQVRQLKGLACSAADSCTASPADLQQRSTSSIPWLCQLLGVSVLQGWTASSGAARPAARPPPQQQHRQRPTPWRRTRRRWRPRCRCVCARLACGRHHQSISSAGVFGTCCCTCWKTMCTASAGTLDHRRSCPGGCGTARKPCQPAWPPWWWPAPAHSMPRSPQRWSTPSSQQQVLAFGSTLLPAFLVMHGMPSQPAAAPLRMHCRCDTRRRHAAWCCAGRKQAAYKKAALQALQRVLAAFPRRDHFAAAAPLLLPELRPSGDAQPPAADAEVSSEWY
jgi:hypothetical protein